MQDPINPEIQYDYWCDPSPSEIGGKYKGRPFHLYARWDKWQFAMSNTPGIDAEVLTDLIDYDLESVQQSSQPFPFEWIEAFQKAFVASEYYGIVGSYDASYMTLEEKMRIVRECIAKLLPV